MSIAQAPVQTSAEQVGVVGGVQPMHLASQVVERLTIVELAFESRKRASELDGCVESDRAGELFGNGQQFT
jgi:hypothetical protein